MKADEIYGTKNPTPHRVLLDTRFELPFGEMPPFGIQRICVVSVSRITHTAPLHILVRVTIVIISSFNKNPVTFNHVQ